MKQQVLLVCSISEFLLVVDVSWCRMRSTVVILPARPRRRSRDTTRRDSSVIVRRTSYTYGRNPFSDRSFATAGHKLRTSSSAYFWQPDISFSEFRRSLKRLSLGRYQLSTYQLSNLLSEHKTSSLPSFKHKLKTHLLQSLR